MRFLGAGAGVEFGHGAGHVGADGGGREEQGLGDLVVGPARGHPGGDLALPRGEGVEARHGCGGRPALGERAHEQPRHRWREQRLSGGHHSDGVHEVGGSGVLEDEAARSQMQRLEHVLVDLESGHHDDPHGAQFGIGGEMTQHLQAVHVGHADVQRHHVGPLAAHLGEGLAAVAGLALAFVAGLLGMRTACRTRRTA